MSLPTAIGKPGRNVGPRTHVLWLFLGTHGPSGFAGWVPVMGTCVDPCYDAFETHQENADCARIKTEPAKSWFGSLVGHRLSMCLAKTAPQR